MHQADFVTHLVQRSLQRLHRMIGVVTLQVAHPWIVGDTCNVFGVHRPEVDLQRAGVKWLGVEIHPIRFAKVVAIAVGVHEFAVDLTGVGVELIEYASPAVYVFLVACEQQAVAKAVEPAYMPVGAVCNRACLRHNHRKSPAVDAAEPAPARFAAHHAV